MAIYRQIQTSYWDDPYILELNPDEKLFYMYLLTNDKTKQCGIYEIPVTKMETELKYSGERIFEMLNKFQNDGKIMYSIETREICIINWLKHNPIDSFNIAACVIKELRDVKNTDLIFCIYEENETKELTRSYKSKTGEKVIKNVTVPAPKCKHNPYIAPMIPLHSGYDNKNKNKNNNKNNNNNKVDIFISAWKDNKLPINDINFMNSVGQYLDKFDGLSDDDIRQAVKNYAFCVNSDDHSYISLKPPHLFLEKMIEYTDAYNPIEAKRDKGNKPKEVETFNF